MFSSKIDKTKELDEQKYNQIFQVKLNYKTMTTKQRTKIMRIFFTRYELCGNVRNRSLARKQKGKFLPYAVVDSFFDIIDNIHVNKLGHTRSAKKKLLQLNTKNGN
jgi:hypothetical protein